VMGWMGEVASLRGSRVPWKDILGGVRNLGLVPVGLGAFALASHVEALVASGHGVLAGLAVGAGATALTGCRALSSYMLFRKKAAAMVAEGKIDTPRERQEARVYLQQLAPQLAKAFPPGGTPEELSVKLTTAYDNLHNRYQGTPDGRALRLQLQRDQ